MYRLAFLTLALLLAVTSVVQAQSYQQFNSYVTGLPQASALTGSESIPIIQNGLSRQMSGLSYMGLQNSNNVLITGGAISNAAISGANITSSTLSSPTMTGTPIAPTAANSNSSTQVATTAFTEQAVSRGMVTCYVTPSQPFGGSVPMPCFGPNGESLVSNGTCNPSGHPTQSACLQEALNYLNSSSCTNGASSSSGGCSLLIYCAGGSQNVGINVNSGVQINVPPLRQQFFNMHGCLLVGNYAGVFITFDSMLEAGIDFYGSEYGNIYTGNNGTGVWTLAFFPQNEVMPEDFVGISSSYIRLGNIDTNCSNVSLSPKCAGAWQLNATNGPIIWNMIDFNEVNCGAPNGTPTATSGIEMTGTTATTGTIGNTFNGRYVHDCAGAAWQLGTAGDADPQNNTQNTIVASGVQPYNGGIGFDIYGDSNTIIGTINCQTTCGGSGGYGIKYESSTNGNFIQVGTDYVGGSNTPLADLGSGNCTIIGETVQRCFGGDGEVNNASLASVSAGSGAAINSGATNNSGSITVGGSGSQTTVALGFGTPNFLSAPNCEMTANQAGITFNPTTGPSTSGVTFTAYKGSATAADLSNGTVVYYKCK